MTETATKPKRSTASHQPTWERFASLPASLTHPYNDQYASTYNARYTMLYDRCLANAKVRTDSSANVKVVPRVIELKEGEASIVVGTIVKTTPGRPEVDTAYHSSREGMSYLGSPYDEEGDGIAGLCDPLANYCSVDKDVVVLEDESGRVELDFDLDLEIESIKKSDIGSTIDKDGLATGVVVAVEGKVNTDGTMLVNTLHFPTMGPQDCVSVDGDGDDDTPMDDSSEDGDVNIMFLSGLDCGGADSSLSLKRELLVDYLSGHFAPESDSPAPWKVARVIVAGGGCTKPIKPEGLEGFNWENGGGTKKEKQKVDMTNVTLPIKELDLFLSELCAAGIPVDYIPGLHDPTNANWPQKPLHGSLLPHASCFVNMLERSPNPYEAKIENMSFLGSDGLNIADLRRFVAKKISEGKPDDDQVDDEGNVLGEQTTETVTTLSSLETLESVLRFNHLVPTGPDSLPIFPFREKDPFVLEKTPHVFFAGNCNEFESKIVEHDDEDGTGRKKTCLVCIPSFAITGQAVLLNLKSSKCELIEFDFSGEPSEVNADTSRMVVGDEKKIE